MRLGCCQITFKVAAPGTNQLDRRLASVPSDPFCWPPQCRLCRVSPERPQGREGGNRMLCAVAVLRAHRNHSYAAGVLSLEQGNYFTVVCGTSR
jgi:hypothetical protein